MQKNLFVITLLLALEMQLTGTAVSAEHCGSTHNRTDNIAQQFMATVSADSARTDVIAVSVLRDLGWGELLPSDYADTCILSRTMWFNPDVFPGRGFSRNVTDPTDATPIEPKGTVQIVTDSSSGRFLFAVAYHDWSRARAVRTPSFAELSERLSTESKMYILPDSCACSMRGLIGLFGTHHLRLGLLESALSTFHLATARVGSTESCVWIVMHHEVASKVAELGGPHWQNGHGLLVEADARSDVIVSWDGFPEHPENIQVIDNLEERFREYQQQRQQWLNEREQKR